LSGCRRWRAGTAALAVAGFKHNFDQSAYEKVEPVPEEEPSETARLAAVSPEQLKKKGRNDP
jgi:hypothetical protein